MDNYKIICGNMLEELDKLEPNSIDSIVTDPPYLIDFMGKEWDKNENGISGKKSTWEKCYRVLKPGGHMLVFGASRTFHKIWCAVENAGFDLKDTILWLYGTGFPKGMNIGLEIDKRNNIESTIVGTGRSGANSRAYQSWDTTTAGEYTIKKANNEWNDWRTQLKPAFEPILVAMKPIENNIVTNIQKYGVGGINIGGCRIPYLSAEDTETNDTDTQGGRYPSNVIIQYDNNTFDEVCLGFPNTYDINGLVKSPLRYFYCPKATDEDRESGLDYYKTYSHEELNNRKVGSAGANRQYGGSTNPYLSISSSRKNIHPTVKPESLMRYLVRLVTPKNGTVLDPFMGSGSTGKAAMLENDKLNSNYKFIGIELDPYYCELATGRISYACGNVVKREYDNNGNVTNMYMEHKKCMKRLF